MAAAEPARVWSDEQLQSEEVQKKELITFIQHTAAHSLNTNFLKYQECGKDSQKEQLIEAYNQLFLSKRFKGTEVDEVTQEVKAVKLDDTPKEVKTEAVEEEGPPKYMKSILKKGDKTNFPRKGDTVSCWYTGTLEDGTVFDTNIPASAKKKKQAKPLTFKVGMGKVIRGWDEGLMTMSKGETARLEIQPEWAYGRKDFPDSKIPPNAKLIFEVELVSID